jgi:hypothetical protein
VRYALGDNVQQVSLVPRLGDRPFVARPETPFVLPPGARAQVFLSTPLWVGVRAGTELAEVPTWRPTDTWFGASTMEGRLCYASRTLLKRERQQVSVRPHRAITTVTLRNEHAEPLRLQRLQLPVPNLALYRAQDGVWWTGDLVLVHAQAEGLARIELSREAPALAPDAVRQAEPREAVVGDHALVRVFNSLFN